MPYEHEEWQIEHMEGALRALTLPIREIMMIRTRGGSKTQDTMKLCLYLTYLGFEGIYFTANSSQLERPKIYMKDLIRRSFLKWCVDEQRKEAVEFIGSGRLELINLTEGKAISPRADFIIFDEERKADPDAYDNTQGIFADTSMLFTIHISTPEKHSIFEDNHETLKRRELEYGEPLVFERQLYDVSYLWDDPNRRARYLELKKKLPGWFWRQEFECSFELPSGAVFQDVIYEPYTDELMKLVESQDYCSGIDWNPAAGHCLSCVKWLPDYSGVVVMKEINLGAGYAIELTDTMFHKIAPWFTNGNKLVIEDGGINIPYVKWFKEIINKLRFSWHNQRWYPEEWDSQDVAKMAACTYIIQHGITIYVDKMRFPETAKCIEEAHWDEDAKGSNPKLAKDKANSPHFLDAFLHAISEKNRDDIQIEMSRFY